MGFTSRGKWGTKSRAFRVNHGSFYRPTSVTVLGVNSRKLTGGGRRRSRTTTRRQVQPIPNVEQPRVVKYKSRSTAYLLWLVLGLIGGHRYYLGRPGTGFLMTITFGGLGVWWVLDAFLIPGMLRNP